MRLLIFILWALMATVQADISITPAGGGGGSGDVSGPGSSTDNAIVKFDGSGGKTIQDSNLILLDSGQVQAQDGAVGTPSYSFASDTDMGIYLSSAGTMSFSASSQENFRISVNAFQFFKSAFLPNGTCASPSLGHNFDAGTGVAFPSATNEVDLCTNSGSRVNVVDARTSVSNDLYLNQTPSVLLMVSPDGTCSSCGVDNSDVFSCSSVACP